jgi:hypothetical protein
MLNSYALLTQAKFYRFFHPPLENREIPAPDTIDNAILQALDEQLFVSL